MIGEPCKKPLAVAIMGPTASGKTDLGVALAKKLNGEIISVDSALVYRGLNIGSAKPTIEEQSSIPHALLDIREPYDAYSVADFCCDAKLEIERICSLGKTPILVGGTMLYFKALLEGLSDMPPADLKVRADIEQLAIEQGWPAVHEALAVVDPVCAARIHPNHSQRLSRALEVFRSTGKPMSDWQNGGAGGLLAEFDWCQIALNPRDRSVLHARIAQRYDSMLGGGLIEEVASLKADERNHIDLPSMRAVGYRQVWEFLDEKISYDDMREKGIVATRQLAKRQLTWLRSWDGLNWIDIQQENTKIKKLEEIVDAALSFLGKSAI
ncbi:MAG: tRNA dimethylallyltransferase [Flavobacteriales bacterium]